MKKGQLTIDHSHQRGFTLAELLVSIGIVVLFTAVLLPGFNSFGRRNELRQTAQLVQTKINEAKSYALAPRHPGGTPITKYAFVAPAAPPRTSSCSGTARYAIVEITQLGASPESRQDIVCEVLPAGIIFTNSAQEVDFSVVKQGAVDPPGVDSTFQIRHPRLTPGSDTRTIRVRWTTGQITISIP